MQNIEKFSNNEFGDIRAIELNGEPWFVGKDVATALGYSNTKDALMRHVDEDDKMDGVAFPDPIGRSQNPVIINESGLYSLVLSSKLPSAKRFRHWVTHDVIPSIRKHGMYATDELLNNPELFIKVLQNLKDERDRNAELSSTITNMQPKYDYCNKVLDSNGLLTTTQIAKDYGMSAKAFNQLLLQLGIQYLSKKDGDRQWLLKSKYANMGYTKSKTIIIGNTTKHTTYWTEAGKNFIFTELMNKRHMLPIEEPKRDNFFLS